LVDSEALLSSTTSNRDPERRMSLKSRRCVADDDVHFSGFNQARNFLLFAAERKLAQAFLFWREGGERRLNIRSAGIGTVLWARTATCLPSSDSFERRDASRLPST